MVRVVRFGVEGFRASEVWCASGNSREVSSRAFRASLQGFGASGASLNSGLAIGIVAVLAAIAFWSWGFGIYRMLA